MLGRRPRVEEEQVRGSGSLSGASVFSLACGMAQEADWMVGRRQSRWEQGSPEGQP